MKNKKIQIIEGIALLIIIFIATMWVVKTHKKPGSMTVLESQAMDMSVMKAPLGNMPVAVETVKYGNIEECVTYTGSVTAYNEQDVSPKVSGYLTSVNVYPGDIVVPGQILASISAPELESQYNESSSGYNAAQSGYDSALYDYKGKIAQLKSAKAEYNYQEAEFERETILYKDGGISKDEYQIALLQLKKTKATLEEAKAELESAQFKANEYKSIVEKEGFSRETAAIFKDYTYLYSLLKGVVTQRFISEGGFVSPGMVIMKVAQIDPVRIQANVTEGDLEGIKNGNDVEIITIDNKPSVMSKVTSVFPSANPDSRTSIVESEISNSGHKFLPGQFVKMKITKKKKFNVFTVPTEAIIALDGKEAVWTVQKQDASKPLYTCVMHPEVISDKPGKCPKCGMELVPKESKGDKTAHLVYITTGSSDGERTEVKNGLNAKDEIIIKGFDYLMEGDPVYTVEWGDNGPKELAPAPSMQDMPEMEQKAQTPKDKPDMEPKEQKMENMPEMKTENKVIYTCPMHPEVVSDKPGKCPKCGMNLVKKEK